MALLIGTQFKHCIFRTIKQAKVILTSRSQGVSKTRKALWPPLLVRVMLVKEY